MDSETDKAIQKTLAEEFQACTVLTIAHRLDTILDSDRVVVMSQGSIVECDSPRNLLESEASEFSKMCTSAAITLDAVSHRLK